MNLNKEISKTPIFDNLTCPEGIKKSHAVDKDYFAKLEVLEGMLEFVFEDNHTKIIVDNSKELEIPPLRLHHVNLIWEVKFQLTFYKSE